MIKTENMTINGKAYIRTWSDTNMMIERDGALYEEAIDPAELGRKIHRNRHAYHPRRCRSNRGRLPRRACKAGGAG